MTTAIHRIYRTTYILIVVFTILFLGVYGHEYYATPLEERFYHPQHDALKPSGLWGHGLGIVGTLLIFIGVFSYILRKRWRPLQRLGRLKYWLEFHIFLCSLGPAMVLFHTAFKFGGIVSVAFWSMMAVVASGVIGRFIYIQIPRNIEGRELGLNELRHMRQDIKKMLQRAYNFEEAHWHRLELAAVAADSSGGQVSLGRWFSDYIEEKKRLGTIRQVLREINVPSDVSKRVMRLFKQEFTLERRIRYLQQMHRLFKLWHVVHLPFALIMLVIVIIHVIVTVLMGAHWIF
ncbi:MAG: hypothetical protein KatS3mg029_0170 [Saprospiraceae bacterium]|nr:MAG: hypothetical protein KatS3mg029_0170 [Saprospiraceae bacterium]